MHLTSELGLFVALFQCCLSSYNDIYRGEQVWQVDFASEEDVVNLMNVLYEYAVPIERQRFHKFNEGNLAFRVAPEDLRKVRAHLKSLKLTPQVLVRDVKRQLDEENHQNERYRFTRSLRRLDEFNYTRYHPLDDIEQWMNMMASEYDFVEKFRIGASYEGRTLSGLKVASVNRRQKPVIYIDAAIHAREWIAPATLMFICNQIVTNSSHSKLLKELDFYFVPVVNLDGYVHSWSHARLWRKTRRPPKQSQQDQIRNRRRWHQHRRERQQPACFGVDANRNWDVNFGGQGSLSEPCSSLYHGPYAESEPVIHHLANFIRQERANIKALITLHNFGQQILYPYNYNLTKEAPTENELDSTAHKMSEAIKRTHGKNYEAGRGSVILYIFSGSTSDWAYEKAGIELSYTVEVRDNGAFSFELPEDQILPTGQEIMAAVEVLANTVIAKHKESSKKAA